MTLYYTTAEALPHSFDVEITNDGLDSSKNSFDDLAAMREEVMSAVLDDVANTPAMQQLHPAPRQRKYLPPGKRSDLYDMYLARCVGNGEKACGHSTFYDVFNAEFRKVLMFRKRSTHSSCSICDLLKSQIKHARSVVEHLKANDKYLQHMSQQWLNRSVYWGLRARARADKDIIVIIQDGMDRSKFAMPRWSRTPKAAEKFHRPVLELSACLIHGYGAAIYITDEATSIGSDWACECFVRSIDKVWKECQTVDRVFPATAVLVGDNTCREIKNSIVSKLMSTLSAAEFFDATSHGHLQVGHTHEDVDA